jgi:hypothetical protein
MAAMSGIQILQDPMRADRAVISIAPFPTTDKFDARFDPAKESRIFSVLSRLVAALISQTRFFGESLNQIMTGTTFGRFVIAPSDDELGLKYHSGGIAAMAKQPPRFSVPRSEPSGAFLNVHSGRTTMRSVGTIARKFSATTLFSRRTTQSSIQLSTLSIQRLRRPLSQNSVAMPRVSMPNPGRHSNETVVRYPWHRQWLTITGYLSSRSARTPFPILFHQFHESELSVRTSGSLLALS